MDLKEMTGGGAALAALLLSAGAWLLDPDSAGVRDVDGLERASRHAVESHAVGQPLTWRDDATGTTATITPSLTYRDAEGHWCRPYALTLAVGGHETSTWLEACRDAAGRWNRRAYLARVAEPGPQLARH